MDARSIAATVRNCGKLTGADELKDVNYHELKHTFNRKIYENQVFDNYGHENPSEELVKGPNIADWPEMAPLKDHILLKVAGSYKGSVTTDELVPSGEASSYRSNPEKISGFTMISRDPEYVGRAKALRTIETALNLDRKAGNITLGSIMISDQIGDGSSREQAASCQKVLGGFANLANEYSTKRYRSNLINWGILPLRTEEPLDIPVGTYLFISDIKEILSSGRSEVEIQILNDKFDIYTEKDVINLNFSEIGSYAIKTIKATLDVLTEEERNILLSGCLINHYKG
jgi:aconitate hydratase